MRRSFNDFIAGQCAGMAQVTVGHPLDTTTLRREGLHGFFKGILSPILGIGLVTAVQLTTFQRTADAFEQGRTPLVLMFSGAVSGAAASPLVTAFEFTKTQLQLQSHVSRSEYKGTFRYGLELVRAHKSVAVLFRGTSATLLREIPGYSAFYGLFFVTKPKMQNIFGDNALATIGSACISGLSYWLVSYPFDAAKSAIQGQPINTAAESPFHFVKRTVAQNGIRGLYRGITPCLLRCIPAACATFLTYEAALNVLSSTLP